MDSLDPHPARRPPFEWTAALVQTALALGVAGLLAVMASNMLDGLARQGISPTFDFLRQQAGFSISETWVELPERSSYWQVLSAGLANTVWVSVWGIFLATVLGVVVGMSALSPHFLLSRLARGYVELIRNVPLLVQLFFWYSVVFLNLPSARQSLSFPGGVFVNNRGVFVPWPVVNENTALWGLTAGAVTLGLLSAIWLSVKMVGHRHRPLMPGWGPPLAVGSGVGFITLMWFVLGLAPFGLSIPRLEGFNFTGGAGVSPEFAALLTGLSLYTSAFIGEVIRGGVLSVPAGQMEAALALGFGRLTAMRLVVMPQALRVIIPPLANQYLNLVKNSSLAVAIAFPDLVSVGTTILNQSGQAVPMMVVIMGAYLALSLMVSAGLNLYNRRVRLPHAY